MYFLSVFGVKQVDISIPCDIVRGAECFPGEICLLEQQQSIRIKHLQINSPEQDTVKSLQATS